MCVPNGQPSDRSAAAFNVMVEGTVTSRTHCRAGVLQQQLIQQFCPAGLGLCLGLADSGLPVAFVGDETSQPPMCGPDSFGVHGRWCVVVRPAKLALARPKQSDALQLTGEGFPLGCEHDQEPASLGWISDDAEEVISRLALPVGLAKGHDGPADS